jgi:hypothetical protein
VFEQILRNLHALYDSGVYPAEHTIARSSGAPALAH